MARDLEVRHPGWVVIWRCWAQRFWAFPCWIAVGPEAVEARHAQDLLALMAEMELLHRPGTLSARPAGPPPPEAMETDTEKRGQERATVP
ncbi:hypothetical protein ACIBLB_33740 [Streptosporangium canum]|uniref:hypothetical protein n=1 Tax=Streptosporangium canum TaxID=324952 RepID=UPI0037BC92F1